MADSDRKLVGAYCDKFNHLLSLNLPCLEIWQYAGLRKHVEERHPDCIEYLDYIKYIIANPDYIGVHGTIPNSIEFVKTFEKDILISVNLDINENYFYVSSLYEIEFTKILKRLRSGRLVVFG